MRKTSSVLRWWPWALAVGVIAIAIIVLIGSQLSLTADSAQQQTQQGLLAYQNNCASCHGADLQGTRQGPPFLHQVYVPSHHGDEAFYRAIANGVRAHHWRFGDMPAVANVSRSEATDIIAYIREQQRAVGIK